VGEMLSHPPVLARLVAKVLRKAPSANVPSRAYSGDAGFDLYYSGTTPQRIRPSGVAHIPSQVVIQWPEGMWGFMIGRSSSFERGLLVNPTVIDAGFRGDLFANVRNVTDGWVEIQPGERIAQIVPMPLLAPGIDLQETDKLDPSDRGEAGFGSSGR
jgi:dUTP pyrophosphatase